MKSPRPGDIVLVRFPFTSLEQTKKRPALVLFSTSISSSSRILTIAMITSQVEKLDLPGDVHLKEWQKSGLLHPSLVRLSKVATLDLELAEKTLGKLAEPDSAAVKRELKKLFKDWI